MTLDFNPNNPNIDDNANIKPILYNLYTINLLRQQLGLPPTLGHGNQDRYLTVVNYALHELIVQVVDLQNRVEALENLEEGT